VPGLLGALRGASAPIVAVSPVVGGRALRGPADRMLESLGGRATAGGVVEHYREHYPGLVDVFVLDEADREEAAALAMGDGSIETRQTVMRSYPDRERLAREIMEAHLPA
jgi:LPPG:FO 2-phospho-L-lactate transferase